MKLSFKYFTLSFMFVIVCIMVIANMSIAGEIKHNIISPFNLTIASDEKTFYSNKADDPTFTTITDKYKDFNEYPTEEDATEPFCQIGGQYKINIVSNALPDGRDSLGTRGRDPVVYNETYNLYYCKTIKDIIDNIRIPASWSSDDLILYCNDGGDISIQNINFDYITSRMNTYKSCVLKNLDLENNNTVIYGYEVGNKVVDNDTVYFFDETTHIGPILNDLEFVSVFSIIDAITTQYEYKDSNGRKYYFLYNNESKFYSLSSFDETLDTNLNVVFSNLDKLSVSRVALIKKVGDKTIYGYENYANGDSVNSAYDESQKPVYKIELDNFNFNDDVCLEVLSRYKKSLHTLDFDTEISCDNNVISIVSDNLNIGDDNSMAFHLFKNIVMNLAIVK